MTAACVSAGRRVGERGPEPNCWAIREQILAKLNPEKLLQEREELDRMSDAELDAWLALAPPRRPAGIGRFFRYKRPQLRWIVTTTSPRSHDSQPPRTYDQPQAM
jgi:hypothetical protein